MAESRTTAEELLLRVGSKESDAPTFGNVALIIEAAFADAEAANLGELGVEPVTVNAAALKAVWERTSFCSSSGIVLTVRGFFLEMRDIGIDPVHLAGRRACLSLEAGAAVKDDHQSCQEFALLLGLADAAWPAATMSTIETTPQAIPNIVSRVPRCAQSVRNTSWMRSRNDMQGFDVAGG